MENKDNDLKPVEHQTVKDGCIRLEKVNTFTKLTVNDDSFNFVSVTLSDFNIKQLIHKLNKFYNDNCS